MRSAVPLLLALTLAACTSGTTDSRPSPSASPSVSSPGRSLVVAVTRVDRPEVLLYRVGPERTATLAVTLAAPQGFVRADTVTVSAGVRPDVCVIWSADGVESSGSGEEAAYCYPGGRTTGIRVPVDGRLDELALAADGERLFWSVKDDNGDATSAVVADYRAGRTSRPEAMGLDCSTYVLSAAWAGAGRMVLHCTSGDNDDPGSLWAQELGPGPGSPQAGRRIGDYEQFGSPGAGDGTSVLALERVCEAECGTEFARKSAARAVRVDLDTGRVLQVIATPAEGRFVASVTGGEHGVVYVTEAGGEKRDVRVYVRWPGEKRGSLISGLPSDVEEVVAQP